MKYCIECGKERPIGRRYCPDCFKRIKRKEAKIKYSQHGHYTYSKCCKICKINYEVTRNNSLYCPSCLAIKAPSSSSYVYSKLGKGRLVWEHRLIVESILKRELYNFECVHHVDMNRGNNRLNNLIVLFNHTHTRLHSYLDEHYRTLLSKGSREHAENCWNSLIVPITTAWLETAGANVIKIWEIGQSASEPL